MLATSREPVRVLGRTFILPDWLAQCVESSNRAQSSAWFWFGLTLFPAHLLFTIVVGRCGWFQLLADVAFFVFIISSRLTRRLAQLVFPMWLIFAAYTEIMPLALALRGEVHVADLYDAELRWFGVETVHGRQILCDVFREHHWAAVDLVCGLVYTLFQFQMLPYMFVLFFFNQQRLARLMWTFLVVHVVGFSTYIVYPAAPPWYVEDYGLGPVVFDAKASPAGVARLDDIVPLGLAETLYSQSLNVFGAVPSLHIGLAMIFFCTSLGMGRRWTAVSGSIAAITAFSAVYFRHHYVWDLLIGASYAVLGYSIVTLVEYVRQPREAADSLPMIRPSEAADLRPARAA